MVLNKEVSKNSEAKSNFLSWFFEKIKNLVSKNNDDLAASLSAKDLYSKLEKIMEKDNIDKHSLQWAKLLIDNWLWLHVVSIIREFPADIHDEIVDLLLLKHQGYLLTGANNNMVEDFKVDNEKTLHKLYYTQQWSNFRGEEMRFDPTNENRQDIPNEITWLKEFEWNSIVRWLIIEYLEKQTDWYLKFLFKRAKVKNFRDLLTKEELEKYKGFLARLDNLE